MSWRCVLESLNDAVEDITGIVQQERVPDAVVRQDGFDLAREFDRLIA